QRELDPHRINTRLPPPVKHLIETGEERELIRIQILNGTSISGLAGTLRDKIQSHSFVDVVETDNADRSNYKNTVIIDRSGHPRSAHRIQELIGTGKIEMDLEEHLLVDVTIIAGEDLKHIVE
ncbi:MAG: LytR C-terminal domain-containing protein, partial [bacterium]